MPGTRANPRGQSVLFWCLIWFAVLQLAIGFVLDRQVLDLRFAILKPNLELLSRRPSPEIVCIGSSRSGSSICDSELTRAMRLLTGDSSLRTFNSAFPVGDVVATEFAINRMLDQGCRPQLVVLELVPEEVARTNCWTTEHLRRQLTWSDLGEHLRSLMVTGNSGRLLLSRALPAYYFRTEICQAIVFRPEPPVLTAANYEGGEEAEDGSALDWSKLLVPAPASDIEARTRAGIYGLERDLLGYQVGGPSVRALERTITRLQSVGARVVLLGVPLASAHRAVYLPEIEMKFQAYLADLQVEFGVPYIDCRDALPDECFLDHHHASFAGAVRFSPHFAEQHLAPLWRTIRDR